ncbi:helix-hairpin-helix domain-containing protein, partial [Roseibium sp. RKSG952]|uniref:helix-hairpin-helix domain-containing protein n=1 Tax=Roseibium sp. RKSG952 TaxID=2529384 RepID=UPI0013C62DE1
MTPVTSVKGVGDALAKSLADNGYKTADDLAKANPKELVKVPRIGAARAPILIAAAKAAVSSKPTAAKTTATRAPARKPATRKPAARKTVAKKPASAPPTKAASRATVRKTSAA